MTLRWLRARWMAISSSSSISGLVRKSKAPARIASMADSTRAVAGDHDHAGPGGAAGSGQEVETVAVAQPDVDQDDVVDLAVDRGQGLGAAGGGVHLVALLAEPIGHRGSTWRSSSTSRSEPLRIPCSCAKARML